MLEIHQDTVVLSLNGVLTAETAGRLRMQLSMYTGAGGPRELVVDLSGLASVDAEGARPLAEAYLLMHLRDGEFRLRNPSPAFARHRRRVESGPTSTLEIVPCTEEADDPLGPDGV